MTIDNSSLGPALSGEGPSPDRDCFSQSRSGFPIKPVGPPSTAGLEAGLRGAPQYRPPIAVRPLSPITEGPAVWRSAWFEAIASIAAPFERGLGPGEDWTIEGCKRRAPENVKALIRAHDMQVRRT